MKQIITAMARNFRDVRQIRSDLESTLEQRGVRDDVSIDVQLVATELLNYGLVHADAPAVSLRATIHDDRVELLVQHSELAGSGRQASSSGWFDAVRSTSVVQRIGHDVVSDSDHGMRTTTVVVERTATTRLWRDPVMRVDVAPPISDRTRPEYRRSP